MFLRRAGRLRFVSDTLRPDKNTMIIVLKPGISKREERDVLKEIRHLGYTPHVMRGVARTVVGAIGDETTHASLESLLARFPKSVESVTPIKKRHKLVSCEAHPANSIVKVINLEIGGEKIHFMAGPCSVESEKQLLDTAVAVKAAGATILRGSAFKPRTSPYEFQGLGKKGLQLLAKARRETGLAVITELLSEKHAGLVAEYSDILQIGAVMPRISSCSLPPPKPAGPFCSSAAFP